MRKERLQRGMTPGEHAEQRTHRPRRRNLREALLRQSGTLAGDGEVENGDRHGQN
jgi:hypothetical protein